MDGESSKIKFIHIADAHLDAWREKELKILNFKAFKEVINKCILKKVNFVLLSGDILNVSMPSINTIKFLTRELKRLRDNNIDIFAIPGSHDLSSDENSFLYVLEEAGIIKVVSKAEITDDGKIVLLPYTYQNKVVIYGMLGRSRGLEREYYKRIRGLKDLDKFQDRYKIFMFHSGVNEILPTHIKIPESISIEQIPKNFNYYAGGHIHVQIHKKISHLSNTEGNFVYPGPVYSDCYSDLEETKGKSFYVYVEAYKEEDTWKTKVELKSFILHPVEIITINVTNLTPQEAERKIYHSLENRELKNKIVLLKVYGKLDGLISHINFKDIDKYIMEVKGAYIVKRNTYKLQSKIYEIEIEEEHKNIEEIEKNILQEHLKNINKYYFEPQIIAKHLIHVLDETKEDNETKENYNKRTILKAGKELIESIKNKSLIEKIRGENK